MSSPEEDAEWEAIVANYGDRPELPDAPSSDEPQARHRGVDGLFSRVDPLSIAHPRPTPQPEVGDSYVPPPPPPFTWPTGARLVAWAGIFGVPALLLLLALLPIHAPPWSALVGLVWFVGGMVYLLSQTSGPKDPDSGWDDGAVV